MEIIQILKALGDETRIRIINILRRGALCVCEIEAILEITQSNASRHLNKLMNAKLVTYY
ncbi:ArsR/SmtB family transcription factor, partial [Clostridioides sp. ZZV15-6598]|uniref:ArsR/SmtB family transcription factor n=1 Tax=Clostridioides sp. ZZV15-6598 TaxID=2811501 RepID=UPI001D11191E|nr:winged helix-turn-helix transcriptional regulator [Clostridioides sp. ZZV15-6598]